MLPIKIHSQLAIINDTSNMKQSSFMNREKNTISELGSVYSDIVNNEFGLRNRNNKKPVVLEPPKPTSPKPQKIEKPIKRVLATNEQLFKSDYLPFMHTTANYKIDSDWRQNNISLLFNLLTRVYAEKGVIQILSIGEWKKFTKKLGEVHPSLKNYTDKELLNIYLRHLIEYEFVLFGENLSIKAGVNVEKTLSQARFVTGKLADYMKNEAKGLQALMDEVVVFQRGIQQLGINYEDINIAKIQEKCGQQLIDIRIQHPLDYGFNITKHTNIPTKMKISEYCEYQKKYKIESYKKDKFGDQLKNGKIFFGVNFEPEDLSVFDELWKKINNGFLGFKQKFDLLSYLDSQIPGCSVPQFYLKVKGCWTGGHQENVNMCAININHGPDPSEWFTIPFTQIQRMRKVLNEKFKCDLYREEGLWFEKINWFIENGFQVKRILQRKGDIVVTGPGTLHWVRSYGIALQSAWNIFPKTYETFYRAIHRHEQNAILHLSKRTVIPFKSLLLKYVDHEMFQIEERTLALIINALEQWNYEQQRLRLNLLGSCKLGLENASEHRLEDLQSLCSLCRQQIFKYYVQSWEGDGVACLQCLASTSDVHGIVTLKLYYKYNSFHLKSFFYSANNRHIDKKRWTHRRFCGGLHIGNIECPMYQQLSPARKRMREYEEMKDTQPLSEPERNQILDKIEELMDINQNLPSDSKKTVAELIGSNPNAFSVITDQKEVQVQTSIFDCSYCGNQVNFYEPKPRKKHIKNGYRQHSRSKDYERQRHHQQQRQRDDRHSKQKDGRHSKQREQRDHRHSKQRDDRHHHRIQQKSRQRLRQNNKEKHDGQSNEAEHKDNEKKQHSNDNQKQIAIRSCDRDSKDSHFSKNRYDDTNNHNKSMNSRDNNNQDYQRSEGRSQNNRNEGYRKRDQYDRNRGFSRNSNQEDSQKNTNRNARDDYNHSQNNQTSNNRYSGRYNNQRQESRNNNQRQERGVKGNNNRDSSNTVQKTNNQAEDFIDY